MRPATLACVVALIAGCAHLERTEQPRVRRLDIVGARQVDEADIKEKILTTESSPFFWGRKRPFDANVWRTDLRRIERYYQARGFYQAKVVDARVVPANGDVSITVVVDEGQPTLIRELSIEGLEALPEEHRREAVGRLPFEEGEVFLEEEWEGLKELIAYRLAELGYAEAKVEGDVRVDLVTREARVSIRAEPGARHRFGEVAVRRINGGRVELWRVREQVREVIEHEEWYSESARREAQARVFGMGVFAAARVQRGPSDPARALVPLEVDIQEAPYRSVRAGFGLGFEEQRNDIHGVGDYTNRDFLGGLRRLTLQATLGYAFIPSAFALARNDPLAQHGPVARLSAEVEQPRLFSPNLRLDGRVELERGIEPAFTFIGGRLRVGAPWRPRSWLTIIPGYGLELYLLESGQVQLDGRFPELLLGCEDACVLSFLEQRAEVDRRDDPLEPRRGYLLGLTLQEGGGPLGGTFEYLRVTPEVRGYFTPSGLPSLTLSGRLRLGTLIPASGQPFDSPIVSRFYSGGDGMRGFGTRRLSPMILADVSTEGAEQRVAAVPIGGNGLFEGSVEARYRLTEQLTLASFVDVGFVTIGNLRADPRYFGDNLMLAVGAGVRYRTVAGPIRLDLSFRPNVGPPLPLASGFVYPPSRGCFGIGQGSPLRAGAPEGPCSIQLSIGEAF